MTEPRGFSSVGRVVVYLLTIPIWTVALAVGVVAFAVGGIAPIARGAYVLGGEFAVWVFDADRPIA